MRLEASPPGYRNAAAPRGWSDTAGGSAGPEPLCWVAVHVAVLRLDRGHQLRRASRARLPEGKAAQQQRYCHPAPPHSALRRSIECVANVWAAKCNCKAMDADFP